MAHLLHGFSQDRSLLLAGGSLGPILLLLFFPRRADAKVLSPGSQTCWAWCHSHPAWGELLRTPAWHWPLLAPISTFWSPGPCAWSHKSAASADLGRRAPPAGSPAPSLPSLPPGCTEAQPETRGALGCVLLFPDKSMVVLQFSGPELFRPCSLLTGCWHSPSDALGMETWSEHPSLHHPTAP